MKYFSILSFALSMFLFVYACDGRQYSIQSINESSLKKLIKERNGKILLLNIWATWCIPCREEFPYLVKLHDDYQNSNVEIIGISADYPDEVNSKIIPFLKSNNVRFKVFVQNFEKQENFINTLNKEWNGGLPATFIFDGKGNQMNFIFGKHDYAYFKEQIEKIRKTQ